MSNEITFDEFKFKYISKEKNKHKEINEKLNTPNFRDKFKS